MILTQLVLFEFHNGAQAVGVGAAHEYLWPPLAFFDGFSDSAPGAAHEYLWPPLAFFDGFSESTLSDDESNRLLTMLGVGF